MDIVTIITSLLLTFSGAASSVDFCEMQTEDTCLQSTACDVFASSEGQSCSLACDARTTQSQCLEDSTCAWDSGACGYSEPDVPGC